MGVSVGTKMNRRLNQKYPERGFTLVEVMVVAAVIAVVSLLAIPNYMSWYARHQLKQATKEIQNQLGLARVSAMSRNSSVTVNVALNSGKVTLSATSATGAVIINPVDMPGNVIGLTPSPSAVTFTSLGIRSGGGTTNQLIVLSNNAGHSYSVQVSPRGNIRWCAAATCS
jgi:prepilin-type N-terminal cleavage/methylation domain-containing protein